MQTEKTQQEENLNKVFTIPNILSFFRLILIPVLIWSYVVKKNYAATGWILLLSGLTDIADGFIARRFHMISNLGKILDPVADKLTQATMLFCLFTRFPHMILPLVLMAFKELYMAVSSCLIMKKAGKMVRIGMVKIVTVLLYGMVIVHIIWIDITAMVSDIMIAICMGMMILSLILDPGITEKH